MIPGHPRRDHRLRRARSSRSRASGERLGLQGAPGDLMLVDLRDRLAAHGRVPPLPDGWRVDSEIRSAHADGVLRATSWSRAPGTAGTYLEIVLVDVSGKGLDAGVRSLQLSGAFGGLLGAMPRDEFLRRRQPVPARQDVGGGLRDRDPRRGRPARRATTGCRRPAIRRRCSCTPGSGRLDVDRHGRQPRARASSRTSGCESRAGRLERGDVLHALHGRGDRGARGRPRPGHRPAHGRRGPGARARSRRRGAQVLAGVRAGDDDDRAVVLIHRD